MQKDTSIYKHLNACAILKASTELRSLREKELIGKPSVKTTGIPAIFFSKSTTNDIPLPFLLAPCEYKAAPVVLDDPPPGAKDVLILN
jgi:hypothetical protein